MTENQSTTSLSNDRLWNVLCHLSPFIGVGLILPLIVYLVTKDDSSSSIPAHAKETLNFHISLFIYAIIGTILIIVVIGVIILIVIGIAGVILCVVGAIKASNEEVYHYPLTLRLVK